MADGDSFLIGNLLNLELSVPMFDPNTGLYWKEVWCGPALQISELILAFNLDNSESDVRYDVDDSQKPLYRLTIITPDYSGTSTGQNNSLNKWELVHNKVEKELSEHPIVKLMDQTEVELIYDMIRGKMHLDEFTGPPLSYNGAILYDMLLKGQNKTLGYERTFRYTITTSKRFGSYISELDIFKLFTTAQLINPRITGLIIPSNTLFNLAAIPIPPYGAVVTSLAGTGGTTGGSTFYNNNFAWSWLKQPPDVEQLPSGRVRITQEWWLDYWSTWEYFAR